MRPKRSKATHETPLFGARLELMLNLDHELVKLSKVIDWGSLETDFGRFYVSDVGRPAIAIRLMAGLHLLKHTFALSDEQVVEQWVENPYWQFFCGEEFFRHTLPINPSQMTRWRKRIGEAGCERLFKLTIEVGKATKTITERSLEKVVVDTTVQPKAIEYPTDARLYRKVHQAFVKIAKMEGVSLRQSYTRSAKAAFHKHARQMKAKRFTQAGKQRQKLKVYAGRVMRDVQRKLSDEAMRTHGQAFLQAELILTQKRKTKGKVYSFHAPEVECIGKGKAHKPYEFGVKVSLATTLAEGFAVGIQACPENPFDGHTLSGQLDQVERLTGKVPKRCHVDRGYKGHGVEPERCQVLISGSRRGVTKSMRKEMKRRSSIEPEIGHMKADGLLGRNFLKGVAGDAMNALLCGVGHNLRKILAKVRLYWLRLVWTLWGPGPQVLAA